MCSGYRSYLASLAVLFMAINSYGQKSGSFQLVDSTYIFGNAPFESCHASSLAALPGNKIMAVWFAGKNEGDASVSIWMSVKERDRWSLPKQVADGLQPDNQRFPCWNPVLFYTRSGLLFLYYKVGSSPATWWGEIKTSADNGNSWSTARKLPKDFLGPIKNKPIQIKNGDILCPSSFEDQNSNKWTIHLERCDSNGYNWRKLSIDNDSFNVIQPSILTYPNGRLQLLCRSRNNVIAESWSYDNGKTWQKVKESSLPNPNSGIDAATLKNGRQLLVYNPTLRGPNGRSILKVAVSSDGEQWRDVYTLEEHGEGEYSYPAVIQTNDGVIHISYTDQRKRIKYVRLKE